MKKCPKCGLTFDDNTNFCPACGERLVKEEPKCPSCGAPISEGDKFCKNCGARLEAAPKAEEPQKVEEAPKEEPQPEPVKEEPAPVVVPAPVEEEPVEEEAPLEEQSVEEPIEEEEKVEEVPSPVEEAPKEEAKPNKGVLIVNMIAAGLCLLAALFLVIGMFGPVFSARGTGQYTAYAFKYFFKDKPDTLRQIRDLNLPRSTYYSFELSQFVLECVLFFGGLIGCLVCTIIGIVKNIMALTKKQEPNIDLLLTAGSLRLLIIFLFAAKFATESNVSGAYIDTDFGWGGGLTVAALAVCLTAALGRNIFGAISKKENLPSTIVRSATTIFAFVIAFAAFAPLTKVTYYNGYYTESVSLNAYSFAETAIAQYSYSSSAELNDVIFVPGLMSMFLSFAGMLIMFAAFKKALDSKSKAAPIVNSVLAALFLIVAGVLSIVSCQEYIGTGGTYRYGFASGPVAGIALIFVIVIPGLIVSNILNKSKE